MLPDCEIHVIAVTRRRMSSPQKLFANVWFHSLPIPSWGMLRTLYLPAVKAVRDKLHDINPDIVHGQGCERECALAAVLSGYPNVITIHGKMSVIAGMVKAKWFGYHWWQAKLEHFALAKTGGIICISEYVRDFLGAYQCVQEIIPNAIQSAFFAPPEVVVPRKMPLLLNVGVVSSRKRQVELLELLGELLDEGESFAIKFVGVCDQQSDYGRQFKERLAVLSRRFPQVTHTEYVSVNDYVRLFDSANALVHFSAEESFGLTFAEGLLRGLKLFASDVGAIREIVPCDSPMAEIFDLHDWSGLKLAIRKFVRDGGDKVPDKKLHEHLNIYSPSTVARRHLDFYQKVLRGQ